MLFLWEGFGTPLERREWDAESNLAADKFGDKFDVVSVVSMAFVFQCS